MMTALDGKIMGSYMETAQGGAAGEAFYDIAFGKAPILISPTLGANGRADAILAAEKTEARM